MQGKANCNYATMIIYTKITTVLFWHNLSTYCIIWNKSNNKYYKFIYSWFKKNVIDYVSARPV